MCRKACQNCHGTGIEPEKVEKPAPLGEFPGYEVWPVAKDRALSGMTSCRHAIYNCAAGEPNVEYTAVGILMRKDK